VSTVDKVLFKGNMGSVVWSVYFGVSQVGVLKVGVIESKQGPS
jgi:hypothetical protein